MFYDLQVKNKEGKEVYRVIGSETIIIEFLKNFLMNDYTISIAPTKINLQKRKQKLQFLEAFPKKKRDPVKGSFFRVRKYERKVR